MAKLMTKVALGALAALAAVGLSKAGKPAKKSGKKSSSKAVVKSAAKSVAKKAKRKKPAKKHKLVRAY